MDSRDKPMMKFKEKETLSIHRLFISDEKAFDYLRTAIEEKYNYGIVKDWLTKYHHNKVNCMDLSKIDFDAIFKFNK